jgi:hypothetical protein
MKQNDTRQESVTMTSKFKTLNEVGLWHISSDEIARKDFTGEVTLKLGV